MVILRKKEEFAEILKECIQKQNLLKNFAVLPIHWKPEGKFCSSACPAEGAAGVGAAQFRSQPKADPPPAEK